MRRLLGLLFAALIWVNAVEAQELNCTVEVNSQQIEGTNKNVFDALQEGISTYMNETKFSNAVFSPNEKIECRLFLTVAEYSDDRIKGELQLQLTKVYYNSQLGTRHLMGDTYNLKTLAVHIASCVSIQY